MSEVEEIEARVRQLPDDALARFRDWYGEGALRHFTSSHFWKCYAGLPVEIQKLADKRYELLKNDPRHP